MPDLLIRLKIFGFRTLTVLRETWQTARGYWKSLSRVPRAWHAAVGKGYEIAVNNPEVAIMQLIKRGVSSICFGLGYGIGTTIITITNALNAGFEAAERRYAKIP